MKVTITKKFLPLSESSKNAIQEMRKTNGTFLVTWHRQQVAKVSAISDEQIIGAEDGESEGNDAIEELPEAGGTPTPRRKSAKADAPSEES